MSRFWDEIHARGDKHPCHSCHRRTFRKGGTCPDRPYAFVNLQKCSHYAGENKAFHVKIAWGPDYVETLRGGKKK